MNEMKKPLIALSAIAAIAIAGYGIYRGSVVPEAPNASSEEETTDPCALNIEYAMVEDAARALETDEEVARAVFDHFMEGYEMIPAECPMSLKGSELASIREIERLDDRRFVASITFDVEPASLEGTDWVTPEARVDGTWLRDKQGSLSIYQSDTHHCLVVTDPVICK